MSLLLYGLSIAWPALAFAPFNSVLCIWNSPRTMLGERSTYPYLLLDVIQMLLRACCASGIHATWNLFIESFGHTWKVKQMVHRKHSNTCARMHSHTCSHTHTNTIPLRETGAWGPFVPSFHSSSAALYSSPLLLMQLYVLSLCLPISGHGRLLFRHFKQI